MKPHHALLALLLLCHGCRSAPDGRPTYETLQADRFANTLAAQEKNDLALYALDAGDLEVAEDFLKEALSADVGFGPAHNNLGKVYFEQGKYYLAAWEFEYAVKLMPHHPEPRNNLGLVFERVRKLDEAIVHYEDALSFEPDNPELLGNLARAKIRRGDPRPELRDLLQDLLLRETRPAWRAWAEERLAQVDGELLHAPSR